MDTIYYAQCWEDADILIKALSIEPNDNILSIASGGDNTFALLLQNPAKIIAIDKNPLQLHLVELKMMAISHFQYTEFLNFLGVSCCNTRWHLYQRLRPFLKEESRIYWDQQKKAIEKGIIHCGKFEKYFAIFRRFIIPLIHSHKNISQLLQEKTLPQQRQFYQQIWANRRWKWLFRVFFGKFLLGNLGRHPSYFRYVESNNIGEILLQRSKRGLSQISTSKNYFLQYILKGNYDDPQKSHPYLQKTNFLKLKQNLHRLELCQADLLEYLQSLPSCTISKYNLSDVFEYMSTEEYETIITQLLRTSKKDTRMTFWTLFVPREIPLSYKLSYQTNSLANRSLTRHAKTFFYRDFQIWQRKTIGTGIDTKQDLLHINEMR